MEDRTRGWERNQRKRIENKRIENSPTGRRGALLIAHARGYTYVRTSIADRYARIRIKTMSLRGHTAHGTRACTSPVQSAELKPNQTHYSMHGRRLDPPLPLSKAAYGYMHTNTIFIEGNLFFPNDGRAIGSWESPRILKIALRRATFSLFPQKKPLSRHVFTLMIKDNLDEISQRGLIFLNLER